MRIFFCCFIIASLGCDGWDAIANASARYRAAEAVAPGQSVEPELLNACNTAPWFDTPTERGWRTHDARQLEYDRLRADVLCPDARGANGRELIARYTARDAGFHTFLSQGNIANFYRMNAACDRALACIDDPWRGYSSRDLTLWLDAGEEAIMVIDAASPENDVQAWMEVIEPLSEGERCGWYVGGCRAGLACHGESQGVTTPENQHCEPAVAPTVQNAGAFWVDGILQVDLWIFDQNDDLKTVQIRAGEIQSGPHRLYNSGRRFSMPLYPEIPPRTVQVDIVDRTRLRHVIEIPVTPQPVLPDGAACDLQVRRNRCQDGSVCDDGQCRVNQAPRILDAWVSTRQPVFGGQEIATRWIIADPDEDMRTLTVQRADGSRIPLRVEARERRADGTVMILAHAAGVAEDGMVLQVTDQWRAQSTPYIVESPGQYDADLDEPCDWGGAVNCQNGTACESDGWRDNARCVEPARACAAEWPTDALVVDAPLELDGPQLEMATACGGGYTWAELITFTADTAGTWRFTLTSAERFVSNFSVRRHCNVRVEAACHEGHALEEGPGIIELEMDAAERITLVVSGRYGGLDQVVRAERLDAP